MTTSIVLCQGFPFLDQNPVRKHVLSRSLVRWDRGSRRIRTVFLNAKRKRRKSWWERFFFDDDGNWLGLRDDDVIEEDSQLSKEEELSDRDKFEAWKARVETILELRESEDGTRSEESRRWDDWILDSSDDFLSSWSPYNDSEPEDERGLVKNVRDAILGREDYENMLYEDRVFRYASLNSAKFLALLILVPCVLDFLVHDYVLMPFLDRYVKTVPLAAQIFDIRRSQKLEIIKDLKFEKARYQLEVEIGKSPPITDDELWWEMRDRALELREKWRLENRSSFANIWSDMVFGISLFALLFFNQSKVALLRFTGYKIINNISDTGKAFLIVLITDIFLGYHSESGWQTLLEIIVEHYGVEVDQSVITIFICLVPVIIDACVKLWMFKFLPKLSPRVATIFREMKRH